MNKKHPYRLWLIAEAKNHFPFRHDKNSVVRRNHREMLFSFFAHARNMQPLENETQKEIEI